MASNPEVSHFAGELLSAGKSSGRNLTLGTVRKGQYPRQSVGSCGTQTLDLDAVKRMPASSFKKWGHLIGRIGCGSPTSEAIDQKLESLVPGVNEPIKRKLTYVLFFAISMACEKQARKKN